MRLPWFQQAVNTWCFIKVVLISKIEGIYRNRKRMKIEMKLPKEVLEQKISGKYFRTFLFGHFFCWKYFLSRTFRQIITNKIFLYFYFAAFLLRQKIRKNTFSDSKATHQSDYDSRFISGSYYKLLSHKRFDSRPLNSFFSKEIVVKANQLARVKVDTIDFTMLIKPI